MRSSTDGLILDGKDGLRRTLISAWTGTGFQNQDDEVSIRLKILLLTLLVAPLAAWMSYRGSYRLNLGDETVIQRSKAGERGQRGMDNRAGTMERLRTFFKEPGNARNSAEAWDLVNGMSVSQIKGMLDEISEEKPSETIGGIEMMLYFSWARIDPLEALEAAAKEGQTGRSDQFQNKQQLLFSAYTGWSKQDPEAAFKWAQSSSTPERNFYVNQMGRFLAKLPPEEAAEKLKAYGPDVAKVVLLYQAKSGTSSPEDRQAFLEKLTKSKVSSADSTTILKSFARNWGYSDPAAALAGVDGIPLDEGQRSQARQWIMAGWAEKDPADALAWVMKEKTPQSMAKQVDIYNKWAETAPEEAVASLDGLSRLSPGLLGGIMDSQLSSYYQGDWFPYGRNETRDRFIVSKLKNHYAYWAASAPGDAEAWLGSLEPSLQQQLLTPSNEKH